MFKSFQSRSLMNSVSEFGFFDNSPFDFYDSMELWLKSDEGLINYGDGAGVDLWEDKSGKDNHAVQATAANQPLFYKNKVNGYSALYFYQDWFQLSKDIRIGTIFMVAAYYEPPYTSFNGYRCLISRVGNNPIIQGNSGSMILVNSLTSPTTYINGLLSDNFSPINNFKVVTATGTPQIHSSVCISTSYTNNTWAGYIAEVMIYNRILPRQDQQQVEKYLKLKYAW